MKTLAPRNLTVITALVLTTLILTGCGRMMHRMWHHMEDRMGDRYGSMHDFGHRGDRGQMAAVSHIFEPTDAGAAYQVIANDPEDAETIAMIQEGLAQQVEEMNAGMAAMTEDRMGDGEDANSEDAASEEADGEEANSEDADGNDADKDGANERQGRRDSRHMGHGLRMQSPWMQSLGQFMDDISLTYTDLPDGGEIAITSENPEVVEMLHQWIEGGPMSRRGGK